MTDTAIKHIQAVCTNQGRPHHLGHLFERRLIAGCRQDVLDRIHGQHIVIANFRALLLLQLPLPPRAPKRLHQPAPVKAHSSAEEAH